MLAGELPARAAAAISRTGRVDDHAIGRFSAPSASAPDRAVIVAELGPWGGTGELVRRSQQTVVSGQTLHLFRGRSPHENEGTGSPPSG
jgi:hypothetical protein